MKLLTACHQALNMYCISSLKTLESSINYILPSWLCLLLSSTRASWILDDLSDLQRSIIYFSSLSLFSPLLIAICCFLGRKNGGRTAFSHRTCITFAQSSLALNRPLFKDVSQVPVDVLRSCVRRSCMAQGSSRRFVR